MHSLQSQNPPSSPNHEIERQATHPLEGKSEVARLLQQIEAEYEAAKRGLIGLSFGTARHDFINARMDQVAICHEQLATHIGEEEATRLIYDHYVNHIG